MRGGKTKEERTACETCAVKVKGKVIRKSNAGVKMSQISQK